MKKTKSEFDWYSVPIKFRESKILMEHFQERYVFELDRKEKINANISIYFGIVTLLIGAFVKLLEFIPSYHLNQINLLFWLSLFSNFVCLIFCSFYLVKSLFKEYQYIITPFKWIDHSISTLKYYDENNIDDPPFENDILVDITGQYAEYAEKNSFSNDDKVADISSAKKWIIIALIAALFAFSSMYIDMFRLKKKSKDIEVVITNQELKVVNQQNKENKMAEEKTIKPEKTNKPTTPQSRPKPPAGQIAIEGVRPVPPKGRIIINEGEKKK